MCELRVGLCVDGGWFVVCCGSYCWDQVKQGTRARDRINENKEERHIYNLSLVGMEIRKGLDVTFVVYIQVRKVKTRLKDTSMSPNIEYRQML